MTQQLHPGPHPDADQLSTFLEGAVSAREREQTLAHLAECAACREMVFLAQSPHASAAVLSVDRPSAWAWRRWLMPMGLAGAALACGLTAVVVLRPHHPAPGKQDQLAIAKPAAPPIGAAPPASPASRFEPRQSVAPAPARRVPEARPVAPSALHGTVVGAAQGTPGGTIGGLYASSSAPQSQPAPAAGIAPAPAPPASTPENPVPAVTLAQPSRQVATGAGLGLNAAAHQPSTATKSADKAPAGPLAPTDARAINSLGLQPGMPSLRIEHERGPDDGLSQMSGVVTDATGAAVSGATVTLRNPQGPGATQVTTADGRFTMPELPAGHYELQVAARGFQSASEQIELKPRDLALLHSVLNVGAQSETVTVEAGSSAVETHQAQVNANFADVPPKLPGSAPALSTVASGNRMLSVDTNGILFVSRNAGKSWKKIKPQWPGKVTQLALVPQPAQAQDKKSKRQASDAQFATDIFQLTTDTGAVWASADGAHWHAR